MRRAWSMSLTVAALVCGCDPVDRITVRFPVEPSTTARVRWVNVTGGRAYAGHLIFDGPVAGPELLAQVTECCGTAASYRDHALYFLACLTTGAAPPTLICGRPGDPPDRLIRHPTALASCDAVERELDIDAIDLATCSAPPRARP